MTRAHQQIACAREYTAFPIQLDAYMRAAVHIIVYLTLMPYENCAARASAIGDGVLDRQTAIDQRSAVADAYRDFRGRVGHVGGFLEKSGGWGRVSGFLRGAWIEVVLM